MNYLRIILLLITMTGQSSAQVAVEQSATVGCLLSHYTIFLPPLFNAPTGEPPTDHQLGSPATVGMPAATLNGTFLQVNGAPFLPFGLYHIAWAGREHALLQEDIQTLGQAGFNLLYVTLDLTDGTVLATANALGLYLLVESYDGNGLAAMISAFADQPAILGWLLTDDFNSPADAPKLLPHELCNLHQQSKWLAPRQLTYVSGGGDPVYPLADYDNQVDVIGIQSYPISNPSGHFETELEQNYGHYCHARRALPGQTLLANVQTFRWPEVSHSRYPTPAELRNMVYGALMNGANGILAYTYYDRGGLLPENDPALWAELVQLNADIATLAPDFLTGTRQSFDAEPCTANWKAAGLHAVLWESADQALLVVINTSTQQTYPVELTLPPGRYQSLQPSFADGRYATGLSLHNQVVTGLVGPEAVQVYRLIK